MKDGIPIALGYLSVSFGFGILAIFYSTGSLPTAIVGTAVGFVF